MDSLLPFSNHVNIFDNYRNHFLDVFVSDSVENGEGQVVRVVVLARHCEANAVRREATLLWKT